MSYDYRTLQVRVSREDLDKERGAVMEEYRGTRNATGRMQDANWVLMMEGSKVFDTDILSLIARKESMIYLQPPRMHRHVYLFVKIECCRWHS